MARPEDEKVIVRPGTNEEFLLRIVGRFSVDAGSIKKYLETVRGVKNVEYSTVITQLNRLKKKNFIDCEEMQVVGVRRPGDRRRNIWNITDAGKEEIERLNREVVRVIELINNLK